MTVKAILDTKGRNVVTTTRDRSVGEAISLLAEHGIGAVVVADAALRIEGIVSERDIVRAIGKRGAEVLSQPLSTVMTAKVQCCEEHHSVNEVMQIMTNGRFRHLPVQMDGRIAGIISIGDVVKKRIEEAEREAEEIRNYIATA